MSSITGIFYRNGRSVSFEQIKKMNDSLSHRGPDGNQVWFDGSVALGHQMLYTTPESIHETLPFEEENSGMIITSDARIDNRSDLAPLLGLEDNETIPDSIFILKSYQKWGENCPDKLLGDFVFAIWDKENQKLFCARDHMGIKPFYYYLSDDVFLFSTEIKALFSNQNIVLNLNELKAALYLINIPHRDITFYKNIFTLKPSHSIRLTQHDSNFKQYWQLHPNFRINLESDEEYFAKFREIFAEAVKCRLRSVYPIGFDLSGGLDSSSIVCMSKEIDSSMEINTFSMIFDEISESDETEYIEKIIESGSINANFVNGDHVDPFNHINSILWHVEQPFYTPNIALIWNKYNEMNKNGIRVLLAGHGGDQCISLGQNYFKDLFVNLKWKKLISEISYHSKVINKTKFNIFLQKSFLPTLFDMTPYFSKYYFHRIFAKKDFLNPEFSKRVGNKEYVKEFYQNISKANTARKIHYHYITYPIQSLLEWINSATAAFLIEPTYPYFDKRLVEFCYGIPDDLKFKFGWNRYIQRKAMENILPKEIQWRNNKTGYDAVHRRNILLFKKDFLEKIIFEKNKELKNYVNLNKLQENYKNLESGVDVDYSIYIWLSTIFYLWYQKFLSE